MNAIGVINIILGVVVAICIIFSKGVVITGVVTNVVVFVFGGGRGTVHRSEEACTTIVYRSALSLVPSILFIRTISSSKERNLSVW